MELKISNAIISVLRIFPLVLQQLCYVAFTKYIKLFFIIKVNTLNAVNGAKKSTKNEGEREIVVCDMTRKKSKQRMMEISIHIYIYILKKILFNSNPLNIRRTHWVIFFLFYSLTLPPFYFSLAHHTYENEWERCALYGNECEKGEKLEDDKE